MNLLQWFRSKFGSKVTPAAAPLMPIEPQALRSALWETPQVIPVAKVPGKTELKATTVTPLVRRKSSRNEDFEPLRKTERADDNSFLDTAATAAVLALDLFDTGSSDSSSDSGGGGFDGGDGGSFGGGGASGDW